MMSRLLSVYHRFIASTRGVVAIEFAMILPVLLIALLATFDGGNAIAVYMKVRSATYILAAITNQYSITTPIQSTDMTAITGATAAVLSPYSSATYRCRHFATGDKCRRQDHRHGRLERHAQWRASWCRNGGDPSDDHRNLDQHMQLVPVLSDLCPGEL